MNNQTSNIFPDMENGQVLLYEDFFPTELSDKYFSYLKDNILWKQETMMMYGKRLNFARLTSWYGDDGNTYSFSGIKLEPNNWDEVPPILEIKKKIEMRSEEAFNSVLLNYYRNGNDSISWHSDNEKEFGKNPPIASISFGCSRKFRMRRYDDNSITKNLILTHGSLLIMRGETQHYWQHMIPKQKIKQDKTNLNMFESSIGNGIERINLTFRNII